MLPKHWSDRGEGQRRIPHDLVGELQEVAVHIVLGSDALVHLTSGGRVIKGVHDAAGDIGTLGEIGICFLCMYNHVDTTLYYITLNSII